MRERYLRRSFAYAKSAVGIDVVSVHRLVSTVSIDNMSSHTKYCRTAYGITRKQNALQGTNERMASDLMAF